MGSEVMSDIGISLSTDRMGVWMKFVTSKLVYGFGQKKAPASGDRLAHRRRGLFLRRKGHHELPAAGHHAALVECVERLLALVARLHQPRFFEDGEMMRHGWLGDAVHLLDQLIDRTPAAAARLHDLLPRFVG